MSFCQLIDEMRYRGNDGRNLKSSASGSCSTTLIGKPKLTKYGSGMIGLGRWDRDKGVSTLVFRHKNGEMWAVQSKCYAETTRITKAGRR